MIEEPIINFLKDMSLASSVVLVIFLLGRRFLNIWEDQTKRRDEFENKLLKLYSTLDSSNEDMKNGVVGITQQLTAMQTSNIAYTDKVAEAVQRLSILIQGWGETNTLTAASIKDMQTEQSTELIALRLEVEKKMTKIEEGNHNNNEQLQALTERLDKLTVILAHASEENSKGFSQILSRVDDLLAEIQSAVSRINPEPLLSEDEGKDQTE